MWAYDYIGLFHLNSPVKMENGEVFGSSDRAAGGAVGSLWSPSTFGRMLLNSAAGGAAGGMVAGGISAAAFGGNFWKGAAIGDAVGSGTAIANTSLRAGLKSASAAIERGRVYRSLMKAMKSIYGNQIGEDLKITSNADLLKA